MPHSNENHILSPYLIHSATPASGQNPTPFSDLIPNATPTSHIHLIPFHHRPALPPPASISHLHLPHPPFPPSHPLRTSTHTSPVQTPPPDPTSPRIFTPHLRFPLAHSFFTFHPHLLYEPGHACHLFIGPYWALFIGPYWVWNEGGMGVGGERREEEEA